MIETAQKEFARQLPAQPYEGELDRMDLMELMKHMRQDNDSLKRDLMSAQQRVTQLEGLLSEARRGPAPVVTSNAVTGAAQPAPAAPAPTRVAPPAEPPAVPRSYTVQTGDSLSGISRKVYGTASRWIDIYQANRDRLSSENALKVGQELRIP